MMLYVCIIYIYIHTQVLAEKLEGANLAMEMELAGDGKASLMISSSITIATTTTTTATTITTTTTTTNDNNDYYDGASRRRQTRRPFYRLHLPTSFTDFVYT